MWMYVRNRKLVLSLRRAGDARIKVDAFNFTRYGPPWEGCHSISRDAIVAKETLQEGAFRGAPTPAWRKKADERKTQRPGAGLRPRAFRLGTTAARPDGGIREAT